MEIIHSLPCSSSVMSELKILFTGTMGAGKTTAIAAISDIAPVVTDVANTDTSVAKARTTVGLDFGLVSLADGNRMRLFGTPGQERFDFMWDILTEGGIGLVLLLDNVRPDPINDLSFFIKAFRGFIDKTGVVLGITRTDLRDVPAIQDYQRELASLGLANTPVFEVDAREKRDIGLIVETLLCTLDPLAQQ